jgi:hypothetical protein
MGDVYQHVAHRAAYSNKKERMEQTEISICNFCSIWSETVIPEPNFPVKPTEFVGRRPQVDAFRQALRQGIATGRTPSFAILGEWGIGKSSLLLKCSVVCEEPEFKMLPVPFSVSKELGDYRQFAETLLDTFSESVARSPSVETRIRRELQNWKLRRVNVGAFLLDRDTPQFFLSSGTAILKHAIQDAWRRLIRPAQLNGVIFFLDDLHNLNSPSQDAVALALRDQFQSFAIENINCSVCFSAPLNYFSNIRSLAEPAVRFYDKVYLGPFSPAETAEYVEAIFATAANHTEFAEWLYSKTGGHPYFMAFICRQLAGLSRATATLETAQHWPEIFDRLEKEKFRADLAHVTDREIQLLRALARSGDEQITVKEFDEQYERVYFSRLTEKGLLIRTGRGRYKLYHPLFRLFLMRET